MNEKRYQYLKKLSNSANLSFERVFCVNWKYAFKNVITCYLQLKEYVLVTVHTAGRNEEHEDITQNNSL